MVMICLIQVVWKYKIDIFVVDIYKDCVGQMFFWTPKILLKWVMCIALNTQRID